jgi:integrase
MATILASRARAREPLPGPPALTLAGVLAALARPEHAGRRDLADLRSAVRIAARTLGLPPESVTAHPGTLGRLLANVAPAAHGLRPARWRNVRSLLGKALQLAGADLLPGRAVDPLLPSWRELAGRLETKAARIALGRLMRFCSAHGLGPEAVDDAVLARFHQALVEGSLARKPQQAHRDAVRAWNRAVGTVPGWPAVVLTPPPGGKAPYVLPIAAFALSFHQDLAAWLARLAGADPLAELPFPPLRLITLRARRLHALTLASALVHRGRDPAAITGLADLVEPAALREALRFVLARSGGQPTPYLHQLATTALTIARHWVGVTQAQEQALRTLARRCDPGAPPGLTAKNRTALRRLEDDPALVEKLLALPERLARGLERKGAAAAVALTRAEALRLQTALAVAILLAAPIRVANLAGLRLDRHLLRQGGQGEAPRVRLVLPASEVKNNRDLEHPLPPWVVALLDLYLARGRPVLQPHPGPWLFPGAAAGEGKTAQALRQRVKGATEKELGLRLTPHQFRHACGLVYLMANPGGHEVVRHLLGHRSIATTIRHYAGMETAAALRHYDAVVLERRREAAAAMPPRGGKGRRRG